MPEDPMYVRMVPPGRALPLTIIASEKSTASTLSTKGANGRAMFPVPQPASSTALGLPGIRETRRLKTSGE